VVRVRHGSGTGLGVPHRTHTRGHRPHQTTGTVLHMYIYGFTRQHGVDGSCGVDGSRGVDESYGAASHLCHFLHMYIVIMYATLHYYYNLYTVFLVYDDARRSGIAV
jgi:hypothetical protein